MIWRVGTGFLVDGPFRLIDATGAITGGFEDGETWSDGADSDTVAYVVRGDRLIEVTEMDRLGWETTPTREAVVLEGLVEDTSEETARFVATVLGDRAVIDEEERIRSEAK